MKSVELVLNIDNDFLKFCLIPTIDLPVKDIIENFLTDRVGGQIEEVEVDNWDNMLYYEIKGRENHALKEYRDVTKELSKHFEKFGFNAEVIDGNLIINKLDSEGNKIRIKKVKVPIYKERIVPVDPMDYRSQLLKRHVEIETALLQEKKRLTPGVIEKPVYKTIYKTLGRDESKEKYKKLMGDWKYKQQQSQMFKAIDKLNKISERLEPKKDKGKYMDNISFFKGGAKA